MQNLLQKWRQMLAIPDSAENNASVTIEHAAAVLMVEVMAADDEFADHEAETIKKLLISHFNLSVEEAVELLAASRQSQHEAHDLYDFSQIVNQQFTAPQKFELLKSMWKVAFVDGIVDPYEEHMIRKLAELLHLSHSDFIRARHMVAEKGN